MFRSNHQNAIACASSGIAAILLSGGTTAHSRFKIPIKIHEDSVCGISMQSNEAENIRNCKLFIWDEAPMMHRHCFEAVDRLLRDITRINQPFGGKIFIIGGDFRQTLPVVLHGFRADIINATIKSSFLWQHVKQFKLTQNMRLNEASAQYKEYILQIGNGTLPSQIINLVPDFVTIQEQMWIPFNVSDLFNTVYDNFNLLYHDPDYINQRAILAALNTHTNDINNHATNLTPGEIKSYFSHDSIVDEADNNNLFFSIEYLNTIEISGLPPHELKLKVNQPVILLRNISNNRGLCNGTRMLIKSIKSI